MLQQRTARQSKNEKERNKEWEKSTRFYKIIFWAIEYNGNPTSRSIRLPNQNFINKIIGEKKNRW